MEENTIKKGFNNGYILRTHAPELAEKFAKELMNRENPYAVGFLAGIKQREKEVLLSRGKNYSPPKVSKQSSKQDKNKDRQKDDRIR